VNYFCCYAGTRRIRSTIVMLLCLGCWQPTSSTAANSNVDLLDLSIEDLLKLEITSASKKARRITTTPAAVFVITQDDIRRSGARSIPEALRMAPGVQVAQIDANKWAVSARGLNGRFANKLLVLRDGRALYTPSFSGVFWDVQDTIMEDIDRIEVIRGPGGTLWGTNAVNGVINIITRPVADSQGGEIVASAATGPSWSSSIRYGDRINEDLAYRAYARYLDEDGNEDAMGNDTADDWHIGRAGVRADWTPADRDFISLTAEAYEGKSGEGLLQPLLTPPYVQPIAAEQDVSGYFAIGNWRRRFAETRELQVRLYFDNTERDAILYGETRDSIDVDVQYRLPLGSRHDIIMGGGYRHNSFEFSSSTDISLTPDNPSDSGYNIFIQDEIQLIPEQLALIVGAKLEHNDLSDNSSDVLPNFRLVWSVNERNHLWAAVTGAVRTPSYAEISAFIRNSAPLMPPGTPGNPAFPVPLATSVTGNPDIRSEELTAYEIGYRTQLGSAVTLDTTVYLHDYKDLRGFQTLDVVCEPSGTSVFVDPSCVLASTNVRNELRFENSVEGQLSGVEVAADWVPTDWLRARVAYTYLDVDLDATLPGPTAAAAAAQAAGQSPENTLSLRTDFSLTSTTDFSVWIRYVDDLPDLGITDYWSTDINLNWRATRQLNLALTGKNLLDSSHAEFVSELGDLIPVEIERTVGAQLRWTF